MLAGDADTVATWMHADGARAGGEEAQRQQLTEAGRYPVAIVLSPERPDPGLDVYAPDDPRA